MLECQKNQKVFWGHALVAYYGFPKYFLLLLILQSFILSIN
jgi:hypothetical protein